MNAIAPSVLGRPGTFLPSARVSATCALFVLGGCAARSPFQEDPEVTARSLSKVITAEDIENYPSIRTVQDLLQRLVPGFRVVRGGARPGANVSVRLLGMSPVFVLNGMVLEDADVALVLDPHGLERIELLKYGASTSLLGMRGAEGAIVITSRVPRP